MDTSILQSIKKQVKEGKLFEQKQRREQSYKSKTITKSDIEFYENWQYCKYKI